jgi:insulysin
MGLRVRIQSLKDPTFLEERIEDFLVSFGSLLEEMTSDTFTYQKEGLIAKKLVKHKSIAEESSDFWTQMQTGYYDFLQGA